MNELENKFIAAGWNKIDANRYQHKDGRKLERDNGFWYLLPLKGKKQKQAFTLGDAIRKTLNAQSVGAAK